MIFYKAIFTINKNYIGLYFFRRDFNIYDFFASIVTLTKRCFGKKMTFMYKHNRYVIYMYEQSFFVHFNSNLNNLFSLALNYFLWLGLEFVASLYFLHLSFSHAEPSVLLYPIV